MNQWIRWLVPGIAVAVLSTEALAEEGGTGHYLPGSMSSFVDASPTDGAVAVRLNVVHYRGTYDAGPLPIAGLEALGVDAELTGVGLTVGWSPRLSLPEEWDYGVAAVVPFVFVSVEATVNGRVVSDSLEAMGDMTLFPVMLTYQVNPDFKVDGRLGVYAPTGDFETGRLANTGKNYWTVEPSVGLYYLGRSNGIEATLITGMDFNTENPDTDYHSGAQFRVEATLAQHFKAGGGLAGLGVSGFYYDQVTADTGDGAVFGDFESRTWGGGPVVSWVGKLGKLDTVLELKWLNEFDTEKRLEGNLYWLKLAIRL